MRKTFENTLIVAGSGRNCGKTSFLCDLLRNLQLPEVAAVKITPHFHESTDGLVLLNDHTAFKIYREENRDSEKDSSRFLQAGAKTSIYIQTEDDTLLEAFDFASHFLGEGQPVVIESAALAKYIHPALFLFVQKENEPAKNSAESILPFADGIIYSDGKRFSISPKQIIFEKTWKIRYQ
ncbi:MAG: hypothetical protein A2W90_17625 [Bacteroidetes bacterium GWF2_42_66]|nr:MAG: hypothetical protein A2W92_16720 [Bacteroidetes bacterium GWA2_42_15]OFX98079.1 MAG: hypothetical protein A2W89_09115 [Bacteroidetes bacterium GWE2_42_39]OFY42462.1 MAG: hypothetical protein A2W90_17625 [Bacteroidetes bacterium GWF2_42_66]HBL74173.1 hypothetical protein [Prolixibacteraceae bacterium]HCR91659.1 hypothetical protein [Prolixibacteraceae bacterium]